HGTVAHDPRLGGGQHGEAGAAALAARLDARPERLKALRAMTGGNPRTTVLLFDLFAANGDGNVHSDLRGLLDMMTPLYKARMENLAEQPRKILAHLMELWAPQAARELAQAAGLPVTTVSGQLTRLESEALVDKVRLPGARRNGYQVSERLFNVWYLMRYAPRRMRQRLNWLVEFMRLWFSGEELLAQAQLRLARHAAGEVDEAALDYSRALASTLPEARAERCQLEWSVFSAVRQHATDTRRALHELFDLDGDDRAYATADDYLQRFGALDAGLAQCPHAADALTEWIDAVKGSLSLSLAEKERVARESARLSGFQYCKLVQVFADERCTWSELFSPTAAATLRRATLAGDFFPDCPDSRLSYTQSMASFAEQPTAFVLAVSLLAVKFNDEWLDKAVRRAMTLDIPDARAWRELGNLLQDQLARYDEAEAAYRQAIDLDPDDPFATANLARLLAVRGERAAAT
ncbi:MAG TPA: tetratricopeptide repeat protein, partial [Accumulibacter sp.]|nr:tetratricopeptide repeat protein [Accumulibacter sp.]